MSLWKAYKNRVLRNIFNVSNPDKSVTYWKNLLFTNTIIYTLPFATIALVPALIYSIAEQNYLLMGIDLFSLSIIALIGLMKNLSLSVRKFLFVFCIYFISISLLILYGPLGPGLLFLLGICFFCTIIYENKNAFVPSIINLIICIIVALLIPLEILYWGELNYNSTRWIALSSNLVFLSFLCSAMIPLVFNGIEQSLNQEKKISKELDFQKTELQEALVALETKNYELESFAYTASHDLQEPLRMITSFLTQLERKYSGKLDEKAHQYIFFAVDGAKRMKSIILDLLEFSRVR
ncbi:putative two-component sensor protein [Indibacter alkaliphilus LW1]|uniref:histidine kinase n=1 Tax=Indibacter alkaliphilus (strain CCUG 57479 / KCTC 22604 / LW1) TaxID=1189612 RepID=S2DTE5_INDAL|nr:histidine kinase dimerization/phospho-acceptor domain-containing protein [Indibacter alkaliphilus]EOZ95361.1 putative two-component sensor protein [Indibacter alkaliphilus LW1]